MLYCDRDLIFGRVGLIVFLSNLDSVFEVVSLIVIFVVFGKYILSFNYFLLCYWICSFVVRLFSLKYLEEK